MGLEHPEPDWQSKAPSQTQATLSAVPCVDALGLELHRRIWKEAVNFRRQDVINRPQAEV